jgi:hypothetical protein
MEDYGLEFGLSGLELGPVVGFGAQEASGPVENGEVFDLLSNCSFLKKELLDYMKVYLRIVSL